MNTTFSTTALALTLSALLALQSSPATPSSPAARPPATPPPASAPPSVPSAPAAPAAGKPAAPVAKPEESWKTRSIFSIDSRTLEGEPAKLEQYRGKVVLIVNVASRCGYTPQYEGLEKLYEQYKDRGLVVLGFPSNDFGGQEPGTSKEIREFCSSKYKVTFPLFEKIVVKPGDQQSIVYRALHAKTGQVPKWNFGKYLVGRDGVAATYFDSKVTPDDKELREAIERALAAAPPAAGK
ncbi:MAG: glutathione peroxidase [Phycisphaerales bacterium]